MRDDGSVERIDDAARALYARDGVVCLRAAFDPVWTDLLADAIAENLAHPSPRFLDRSKPGDPARFVEDYWVWRRIDGFRRYAFESPAAATVGALLQAERITLLMDNWFLREAGAPARAPWHQDEPYFDFDGRMAVIWTPLEDAPRDQGLVFAAGSHRTGLYAPTHFRTHLPKSEATAAGGETYRPVPDIDAAPAGAHRLMGFDLRRGDCLIFDMRTLHAGRAGPPPDRTIRRVSLRLGADPVTYRPRGPWTLDDRPTLEAAGLAPGDRVAGPDFPTLWARSERSEDRTSA